MEGSTVALSLVWREMGWREGRALKSGFQSRPRAPCTRRGCRCCRWMSPKDPAAAMVLGNPNGQ